MVVSGPCASWLNSAQFGLFSLDGALVGVHCLVVELYETTHG